jgi:hypothetical protein
LCDIHFTADYTLLTRYYGSLSWELELESSCGRQSVDQCVWVSGLPLGPLTRFYLALLTSSDNYFFLLSKAPSPTRKRVCSLQCNHSLVRLLTPNNHTLLSHLRLFPFWRLAGTRGKYSNPPPHGKAVLDSQSESELYYNWQSVSVSQSVCLGVKPNLGLLTRDPSPPPPYCPVFWGRPLWREVGSVLCQSFVIIVSVFTNIIYNGIYIICVGHSSVIYNTSATRPRVAVVLSGDWLNDIVTLRSSTSLSLPARITRSPSQSSVFVPVGVPASTTT